MHPRNRVREIAMVAGILFFALCLALPALGQDSQTRQYPPSPLGSEWEALERALADFPDLNREAVMEFIAREFPDELREFKDLSVRHLSRAVDLMSRMVDDAIICLEARQRDPELFEKLMRKRALEKRSIKLAETCRTTEGEERERAVAELRETLAEIFLLKQEFMKADLSRLEKELDELRGLIAKRESRREGLIDRRLGDMLGECEDIPW